MKKVGIILRTKNRPLFLERAIFKSILNQTFPDYNVYVINDGGEVGPLDKIQERLPEEKRNRFFFVNLPFSLGRGGALSAGLSHSIEPYTLIHDDDDTLEPEFLEKTVFYLEKDENKSLSGVKTSNYDVTECILDNEICLIEKTDKYGLDSNIIKDYLIYLSYFSFIPTCSFLFRRVAMLSVGSADPDIDFGEDSDLIARLMQWGDVGVIKDFLCSIHRRENVLGSSGHSLVEKGYDRITVERNNIIRDAINKSSVEKIFRANTIQSKDIAEHQIVNICQNLISMKDNFDKITKSLKCFLDKKI